jgi:hypothetical protein
MVEAGQTTATTGEIWAIVIVAVLALAFWLTAIMLADRSQVRASGPQVPGESGPAGSGSWVAGGVPGVQPREIPGEAEHEPVVTPGAHSMPRQRTGDADRAERSYARPGTPDDEESGR